MRKQKKKSSTEKIARKGQIIFKLFEFTQHITQFDEYRHFLFMKNLKLHFIIVFPLQPENSVISKRIMIMRQNASKFACYLICDSCNEFWLTVTVCIVQTMRKLRNGNKSRSERIRHAEEEREREMVRKKVGREKVLL